MMLDWTEKTNYQFTASLSPEEWAWEFLRRNQTYQKEWQDFIQTWRSLEQDYGKAPHRNMHLWHLDERSWVSSRECEMGDCRIDQDKVLIECAMGAKWGFYKFPPDPMDASAVKEHRLRWRDVQDIPMEAVLQDNSHYLGQSLDKVALPFDLNLPLKKQLEQAKHFLQIERKSRLRLGFFQLTTIANEAKHLTKCLRVVDALNQKASLETISKVFSQDDPQILIRDATYYAEDGFRKLRTIPI